MSEHDAEMYADHALFHLSIVFHLALVSFLQALMLKLLKQLLADMMLQQGEASVYLVCDTLLHEYFFLLPSFLIFDS